jgi:hypothetical protein
MKFPLEKTMEQERPELLFDFQPCYWFKKHPRFINLRVFNFLSIEEIQAVL